MRVATVMVLLAWIASSSYGQMTPMRGKAKGNPGKNAAMAAPESAHALMKDVIYNELHDREKDSFWEYRSHVVTGSKNVLREQIETPEGPVYRVLARNGQPLAGEQAAQEKSRLTALVNSPGKMRKVEEEHEADESRLGKVMALLPQAYSFHYVGARTGDRVVLDFAPNPKFVPSGYLDRILSGLAGQVVVNQRLKRMIAMDGRIAQKISFGYGILGYVNPGGTFEIHRTQVSAKHWKTNLVEVNVHGRVLLFSHVSKQEKETRWGFTPVSHTITLAQARRELKQAATEFEARAQGDSSGVGGSQETMAENLRER